MNQENTGKANQSDTILDNLLDGVVVVDVKGAIIYANRAAGALFGKSTDKFIGENFGYPVTPFEMQELQVIQGEKVCTVEMLATTILWDGKDAFLMALRDITEKKKLEDQLQNAYKGLMIADEHLKKLNSELEEKVMLRTIELEKKNSDLNAYAEHLKKAYEETEAKVTFRNLEMEKAINELKAENEKLKGKLNL